MANRLPSLRVERNMAFVDAVLAIVLTILVLGIEVPDGADFSPGKIKAFLAGLVGDLHAYVGSFAVVASFWVQHTVMAHYIVRGSRVFQWLNLLFLLPISLIPFATKLRAEYPASRSSKGSSAASSCSASRRSTACGASRSRTISFPPTRIQARFGPWVAARCSAAS